MDAAALIGTRSDLRLAASVTPCPAAALDEVAASGLLTTDGSWLRFRHEIARLAVEQAIAGHRRGAIHARILAALGSLGCDDDARMAFHAAEVIAQLAEDTRNAKADQFGVRQVELPCGEVHRVDSLT